MAGYYVQVENALERFSERYSEAIAAVLDVIATFVGREQGQGPRNQPVDLIKAARLEGAQKRFEFRKRLFDRIEVRTVRGQESQPRASAFDRDADVGCLWTARLSMTTTSPRRNVGTRTWST